MPRMTGSRAFAEMVKGYGVTHVFFVPTILLEALAEMDDLGVCKILTHGEKAAAYMADGYARAAGRPGVCLAQQIGASNLAAGLRDSRMAGSPVVAVTGGPATAGRYRRAYQEVEDFAQFDAVTKLNLEVDDVTRLPDLMRHAFRAATSGAPGPVHLRLRGSHGQVVEAEADLQPLSEPQFSCVPAFRPAPEPERVREAVARLTGAQRPIIVAGGGVVMSQAQAELVEFAEKLQIPVATSLTAKGAIPDNHALSVGVAGVYSRACANQAVSEADLVFFVGNHTGGQVTANWKIPAAGTPAIQLDIDGAELGRNYPNAVSLLGDAKVALRMMVDAAQRKASGSAAAWTGRVQELVKAWRLKMEPMLRSEAVPLRPERLCREITEALPDNGVVVSDTGHAGMWTGQMIDFTRPGQRYIRCEGSLGWGLPGAMGVKCALPDHPVLCFTGDGGLYYHLPELETAARHGINLVVVINNNSSLNQEIPLVRDAYKEKRDTLSGEIWRFQTKADLGKVAEALGCAAFRVEKPGQLKELLPRAWAMNKPVVIDCISEEQALAPTAWLPGAAARGH
ncbi:MAG: thiamine pyrophosphate-binding protein [Betaproteobacteria bacterium]|nr:MAG: thiamine pyrophosphate-binding protein [Betaproteobacteria bacterium]